MAAKLCPDCGSKQDANHKFCKNCGASLNNVPEMEDRLEPAVKNYFDSENDVGFGRGKTPQTNTSSGTGKTTQADMILRAEKTTHTNTNSGTGKTQQTNTTIGAGKTSMNEIIKNTTPQVSNVKRCSGCGQTLHNENFCPKCGQPTEILNNVKKCPNCGQNIYKEKFCPKCGQKING